MIPYTIYINSVAVSKSSSDGKCPVHVRVHADRNSFQDEIYVEIPGFDPVAGLAGMEAENAAPSLDYVLRNWQRKTHEEDEVHVS